MPWTAFDRVTARLAVSDAALARAPRLRWLPHPVPAPGAEHRTARRQHRPRRL